MFAAHPAPPSVQPTPLAWKVHRNCGASPSSTFQLTDSYLSPSATGTPRGRVPWKTESGSYSCRTWQRISLGEMTLPVGSAHFTHHVDRLILHA